MSEEIFKIDKSRRYKTLSEARENRERGERICYDPFEDYYYIILKTNRGYQII